MVTVYVREVEQLDAQLLGEFLPSEISCLSDLFKTFETYIFDDPDTFGPCTFAAAQFVSVPNKIGVFLEIIVKVKNADH